MTFWQQLKHRITGRTDDEIERELRDHLDLEAEEQQSHGLSADDARCAAQRAFGNTALVKEDTRAIWGWTAIERLMQDARYALRSLRKSPGFTTVAVLSLALGIGANTAIFTFVNAALLKPLPYPDASRIVALRQRPLKDTKTTLVHPRSFVPWQDRATSFESMGLAQAVPTNTEGLDGAEQVPGLWITPELFNVFGVQPLIGRGFSPDVGLNRTSIRSDDPQPGSEVILSHGYWQRRFGSDHNVIGRSIPIGQNSAVVVGVMPTGFNIANAKVDLYTPLRIDRNKPDAVGSRSFLCFARLRDGVSMESAQAELSGIAAQVSREVDTEKDFGAVVMSLRDYLVSENRSILLILPGVVAFVLLIACANLASLLLTRGVGRQSELAVRAALGAGRWRITQQLAVESLMLSFFGGSLGLFAGWAGSRALVALSGNAIDFGQTSDVGLDARVLAFTLLLSCITALVFGLAPAWQASRVDLHSSVRGQSRGAIGGRGQRRLRSALVVAEVTLAVVLLTGAGLLLRTFSNLMDVKLGFQPENAISMRTIVMGTPEVRANLIESILERIETLPGVNAAGTIQFLPLAGWTNNGPFHFVGRPRPADPISMESDVSTVSRGYFKAIGMELLRGRDFSRSDRMESPRVALVNQAFVNKYSPNEDPIGRIILGDWANPKPTEIIGVVGDVRHNGLTADPRPTVFLAQSQVPGYITYFVVRTTMDAPALAAAARREVRQIDPRQPITDVQPLSQYVATALARPRLYANFVGAFASLALFLAAIGLYGLLAYAVSQRTHEIGLRMALGARPGEVLANTIAQGARLAAAGLAIGLAAAYGLSRVVEAFLYGVRPTDLTTYAAVAGVLALVSLAAAFIPARRASRVDPMTALRSE